MSLTVYLTDQESVEVSTLRAASQAVQSFVSRTGMGSSEFYRASKAGVVFNGAQGVAHVSYNGRVWNGTNLWTTLTVELTDLD